MCFDPISLAVMAASAAASAGGAVMQNQAQNRAQKHAAHADAAEAQKRREVMQATREKLKKHAEENQRTVSQTVQRVDQSGDTQQMAEQSRIQQAQAIQDATPVAQAPTLGGAAPSVVQDEYNKRLGTARGEVAQRGAAQAKLAGFGDMLFRNDLAAQDASRRIDTTNNFARGDLEILPYEQDLEAYIARPPARGGGNGASLGAVLQGLGQLGGAYAGSGKLGATAATAAAAPTVGQFITGGIPATPAAIPKGMKFNPMGR